MKHSFKNQRKKVQVDFKENSYKNHKHSAVLGFWIRKSSKTYNFWPRPACLSAKWEEQGQLSPQALSSSDPMRSHDLRPGEGKQMRPEARRSGLAQMLGLNIRTGGTTPCLLVSLASFFPTKACSKGNKENHPLGE